MAEKNNSTWPFDGELHDLQLGKSFDCDGSLAFHSIRYDFKPMSMDTSQNATLEIGEGDSVSVVVPNNENSSGGNRHTRFQGNKKSSSKECVLIFDPETNTITLEKLTYSMQVKSTRAHVKSNQNRLSNTGAETSKTNAGKSSIQPAPVMDTKPAELPSSIVPPRPDDVSPSKQSDSTSDNDSSSDDSDSDDEDMELVEDKKIEEGKEVEENSNIPVTNSGKATGVFGVLEDDLCLSEDSSGSDSD